MSSTPQPELSLDALGAALAPLLQRTVTGVERIGGGRNSQIYKVTTDRGRCFALKSYFRHPADPRDRLAGEFNSLSYLWQNGFREIPQPIAADPACHWAVYEFVEGARLPARQVGAGDVDAAAGLLGRLRELSRKTESRALPPASEAFFSVRGVVQNVRQRWQRVCAAADDTTSDGRRARSDAPYQGPRARSDAPYQGPRARSDAPYQGRRARSDAPYPALREFLENDFTPLWDEVIRWSAARLQAAGMSFGQELTWEHRTLSPSDFGFHNALRRRDGRLIFLDFEYFGWDDPAKMIADFLLHPAMNLTRDLKRRFAAAALRRFADWPALVDRVESVYPLFGLKWCLILLNEFLPDPLLRRQFAACAPADRSALQRRQLAKARQMLDRVRREYERFPYRD